MNEADRCELCGYRSDGTARDRMRHLKEAHPAYARGVFFRVAAPGVYLAEVFLMAVLRAPQWVYFVALGSSLALLVLGKLTSRAARRESGAEKFGVVRLVREGGMPFLLLLPAIMLLIAMTRR
jgi:hypothetical protein